MIKASGTKIGGSWTKIEVSGAKYGVPGAKEGGSGAEIGSSVTKSEASDFRIGGFGPMSGHLGPKLVVLVS